MIFRIWRGQATVEKAPSYFRHVTGKVFPALRKIQGFQGAYLLQRKSEGRIEFLAVTKWDSMEAIKRFAGERPAAAVVEPEARAALAEFDDFVSHYELAWEDPGPGK